MKTPLFLCLLLSVALPRVGATTETAGLALDTRQLATAIEAELRGNILPFWLKHTRDLERGGFFGEIRNDLSVQREAPRGALLSARILWTFSAAYLRFHDPEYLAMAKWAYADLEEHFRDREFGGYYWRVSAKGVPLDARKITYGQAFCLYGLSEYYRASGDEAALARAKELFGLLETRACDAAHGGYFEEFSRDWKISRDRTFRGSAMGSRGQKSQNVHLHVLEAFTNLSRIWPDAVVNQRLREVADVMATRVLDPESHHLGLFFDEDWRPVSHDFSYGHDIEYAWLAVEAAEQIGDPAFLATTRRDAIAIAEVTLKEGVDPDGGVASEGDVNGIIANSRGSYREWWAQAEAAVGFLNAYQLSCDEKFLRSAQRSWTFIEQHLVDRSHGEWFQGVTREGRVVNPTKVGFWKCPYHSGRACLELLARLSELAPSSQLP